MPATNNSEPAFDIHKPSKSAPSSTSRPVITTHNPMMKDPMVNDSSEPEPKEATKPLTPGREKVIVPISEPDTKEEKAKKTAETEAATKESDKKESEAAVVDAVAEQAGKKKKNEPTKEDVAREAELEKMIEEKKYFVPIGQVNHRRNKRWFWSIFIVIVLLAAGYLAVDANMIDLGIKLPYEFIT